MSNRFVREAGLIAGTAIGAGMFALPYLFERAGWFTNVFYLVAFGALSTLVHLFYWRVLERSGNGEGLLGFARRYAGKAGLYAAFFIIVGGLIFTLLVYLILARQFIELALPSVSGVAAIAFFWLAGSLPVIGRLNRMVGAEVFGFIAMVAISFFIFFSNGNAVASKNVPSFNLDAFLLPFGPVLFALAAWTAVEPAYRLARKESPRPAIPVASFSAGALAAVLFYLFFVFTIFRSTPTVTPDTISGLHGWSPLGLTLLSLLGLFAIWTSYVPIGFEVRNALERDLKVTRVVAVSAVFLLPIFLLAAGLTSFFRAVSVVGGVFLSFQYLLILLVAHRALRLSRWMNLLLVTLGAVFLCGAVYEIYHFVLN